jgi:hydroxyacylglutathione hydrolase
MNIIQIPVGPLGSNCYILHDAAGEALVIDPGFEPDTIDKVLREHALRVIAYPITHGHFDHVTALAELVRRHPAPIGLHPADASWAFSPTNIMPPYIWDPPEHPGAIARAFADNQCWTDGSFSYRVLHTPGHSPGGVCFWFEQDDVLVSGDTLFAGSIGRVDLPGGDIPAMNASLQRLKTLPDTLRVLPGHGPETTMGHEKKTNPYLIGALPL